MKKLRIILYKYRVDGQMTGKGVYCFSNGDRCVGTYVNGKKEGQGTMFYASVCLNYIFVKKNILFSLLLFILKKKGEKYVGSWVDGKTIGKGEYYYLNKDKYEGDFIEVLLH